jgi:tRNA(His) 5'-end guanylyltransferase
MKSYYEEVSKTRLVRRMPVIIRIDGKAFHTFTRGMNKPFDDILINAMQETTKYLCQHVQGCKLGYTQSDEISLLVTDYDTLDTDAWFEYEVQKMCSVAASIATMAFNYYFEKYFDQKFGDEAICDVLLTSKDKKIKRHAGFSHLFSDTPNMAMFDARCFNLPKEEVANYFYWRQVDAMRNSVNMVGQAHFSPKEMNGKSVFEVRKMLEDIKDNWENYSIVKQRGTSVFKKDDKWFIDENMPILKGENRTYVDCWLEAKQ